MNVKLSDVVWVVNHRLMVGSGSVFGSQSEKRSGSESGFLSILLFIQDWVESGQDWVKSETHQFLLLLIRDWVECGPATLIWSCCVEPKLTVVFPKALLP